MDTPVNTFKSGAGYVNLKVGESKNILATAKLLNGGEVSFPGVTYQLCGMEGYSVGNIASVTSEGKLTANNAGKAKLIIMATDRIKKSLSEVTNYLQISEYLSNDAYVIIDVIVSDGSEHNPFLISS